LIGIDAILDVRRPAGAEESAITGCTARREHEPHATTALATSGVARAASLSTPSDGDKFERHTV